MYDPCTCCWAPTITGDVMVEGAPNGTGEVIDAPSPNLNAPLPDPVPPLPSSDTDPPPSFDPLPLDEEGLVPDLDDSSQQTFQPLIRPASFQLPASEGAPVLQRMPRVTEH